ncbi:MAG: hypothetical protein K2R98_27230 [Gemmataceae bacterium]|nr:hypothetical protein [Gemmataceae bacterium]
MAPRLRTLGMAALLATGLAVGCHLPAGGDTYTKDPLLMTKKPTEGTFSAPVAPSQLASSEPKPPAFPTALVSLSTPVKIDEPATTPDRPGVPAQPTATRRGPVVATPAVRSSSTALVPTVYGHAADHSWLQGVLDRHYQGHFDLRFCDPTIEDSWGGKVSLDDDPRLAQFLDDDIVRVDGELVPADAAQKKLWSHYPRYRIRDIRLIQRKN